jgi:hypothetical protein
MERDDPGRTAELGRVRAIQVLEAVGALDAGEETKDMSNIIKPFGGPTPTPPRKTVIVQFEMPVAAAVITALAEMDAMSHVRLEGLQSVGANDRYVEILQLEKSLRAAGYDAIVRAIRGLEEPGQ